MVDAARHYWGKPTFISGIDTWKNDTFYVSESVMIYIYPDGSQQCEKGLVDLA
jgi:hypothetical protein